MAVLFSFRSAHSSTHVYKISKIVIFMKTIIRNPLNPAWRGWIPDQARGHKGIATSVLLLTGIFSQV
jgi:hypothetical protein